MIEKFISISENFKETKFYIKPHPILPIKKLNMDLPKNFKFLDENFSEIARQTSISICYGNTSATIESLIYGCNLIIPYNNFFDKKNLIFFKINKNYFRICSNNQDIVDAIHYFNKKVCNVKKNNRNKIKETLFNKINNKNISILI